MQSPILLAVALVAMSPGQARAQLDPLLFLKDRAPNVLVVVDAANRMQRDAPTDPANPKTTSNYYDPYIYTGSLVNATQQSELGLNSGNMNTRYRRKYTGLDYTSNGSGDKFTTSTIVGVGDLATSYTMFEAPTRMAVARAAVDQLIRQNTGVARFGLIKMRQGTNLSMATNLNSGPVNDADVNQLVGDLGGTGKWAISRPSVTSNNGASSTSGVLVAADAANSNTTILTTLLKDPRTAGALLPAGNDDANTFDAPVKLMLDDAKTEATRLIGLDTICRNTVVVLIVGGGEGNTTSGANPATTASSFLTVSSRRVPIYVIAIAPPSSEVNQLQNIAANSGGQYFEITKAMIDAAIASPQQPANIAPPPGTVIVPEMVKALNIAVQHGFAAFADFNTAPTNVLPFGPQTEFQVTSPIIGTVNLEGASDINGAALPNTTVNDKAGTRIPQRSNVLMTTSFALPSFDGKLRAFRSYKPTTDNSAVSGYKFTSDGTRLWVASAPAAASRNIYTVLADGTMTAFTAANANLLATALNLSASDAASLINYVRALPLGPFVGSTPAALDPPSIDPPPDPEYPGFSAANKGRRSVIWIGGNDGMMHAIDGRLGVEVWAFIPYNLLPKLRALRDGWAVGSFDYFVDSSAKIADVRVSSPCTGSVSTCWRSYLFFGLGPGGTFYQAFDVTMDNMATAVTASSDNIGDVLAYFADPTRITFKWAFPDYSHFDVTAAPYGDLLSSATAAEKTVGQTWSDPAVGRIESASGKYAFIAGSGFLPYSQQQQANRGGVVAGTTLYLLNVETGVVYDSKAVGTGASSSDGLGEAVDNCVTSGNCSQLKNAVQADPVATGPPDSRYVTKTYIGDLDGRVWRFDLMMNATSGLPAISGSPLKLYDGGAAQPIFASMATVNVGSTQQYIFFGTGSDLLPSNGVSVAYKLVGVLDQGTSGSQTFAKTLTTVDGTGDDEKVTAFPAVAGDIVFFTTTSFKPAAPCTLPDAKLYALTFIGGAAYDTTGDDFVTASDTPLVMTIAGARATAPFVVDQHLQFSAGGKVELLGDSEDYNNGVGQVGVRILSWREFR
jgi:hypothetical protein